MMNNVLILDCLALLSDLERDLLLLGDLILVLCRFFLLLYLILSILAYAPLRYLYLSSSSCFSLANLLSLLYLYR